MTSSAPDAAACQARWADAITAALVDAGVTEVIVGPGSRSTPLVLAVARREGLRLTWVIDERSAAFVALGQARATGRPSALLVTSGTAGAHAFPAVVEAGVAFLPLIVITANRPPALQGCGASQTVEQTRLFGDHARRFVVLGPPRDDDDARTAVRRQVVQLVQAARAPSPGAVHLDAAFDKPLEPPAGWQVSEPVGASTRAFAPRRLIADTEALREVAAVLATARRPLIVCGPAIGAQAGLAASVAALAKRLDAPVYAESASGLRFADGVVAGADALGWLAAAAPWLAPDVVVQLGASPVLGAWEKIVRAARPRRIVIAEHGWPDPTSDAAVLLQSEPTWALDALAHAFDAKLAPHPFGRQLATASAAVWRAVEAILSDAPLAEATVARAVRAHAAGRTLLVGNSLPVRHLDAWVPSGGPTVRVHAQRGAAGIDGLISAAAGVAALGEPTTLLLGDVSFLHDVGALAVAARLPRAPLTIVVVDNGGGRIFDELPLAGHADAAAVRDAFTTPHGLALDVIARGFGLDAVRVEDTPSLTRALERATDGTRVIVCATPAERTRAMAAAVLARATAEIHAALGPSA